MEMPHEVWLVIDSVVRKLRTFCGLPGFVAVWLAPCWLLLGLAKLAVWTVPFQRLAKRLGTPAGSSPYCLAIPPQLEHRARLIRQAIRIAANYAPWNANCYPQALAARLLLGYYRVPCLIYFGVRRDEETGAMKAHVWIACGRVAVTGGYAFDQFTVAGIFESGQSPSRQPYSGFEEPTPGKN